MIVATAAVVLLTVLLGGCQPAAPKPATSQDIGFTIYCQQNPGKATCPP